MAMGLLVSWGECVAPCVLTMNGDILRKRTQINYLPSESCGVKKLLASEVEVTLLSNSYRCVT